MDVLDNKYNSASYRLMKSFLSAGMGKAIGKIPFKTMVNMVAGYKTLLETYVLPQIEDSWNKFVKP